MARRPEDATVWIGYADFLTTLAVLFFILVAGLAAKVVRVRSAHLQGVVVSSETRQPLHGCSATLNEHEETTTDAAGRFVLRIDSLGSAVSAGLAIRCERYQDVVKLVRLAPGDTTRDTTAITPTEIMTVETLPGDALFSPNEFVLDSEAKAVIVELGLKLKERLAPGEVIAVQGHTDDLPFQSAAGKDNWMLSGERAAAAARVLTDPSGGVAISPCQVAIMGFGPSRPIEPVSPTDAPAEKAAKRQRNRRIEFRKLQGTEVVGGHCAD